MGPRPASPSTSLLAVLLAFAPACDNVDVGRDAPPADPPVIRRVLVQDALSYTVTDLLEVAPPASCDDEHPCPLGAAGLAPTCAGGLCQSPTAAANPVAVGDPGTLQIRVVLSGLLDPAVEDVGATDAGAPTLSLHDPAIVAVFPGAPSTITMSTPPLGALDAYYDPSGSPTDSADPLVEPLGPALVVDLDGRLEVGTAYTIRVDAAAIVDKQGRAATRDANGPIPAAGYTFTTVPLAVVAPAAAVVVPTDVVQLSLTAPVDEASLAAVAVRTGTDGPKKVATRTWLERGMDPTQCTPDPRTVDIAAVDEKGARMAWPTGDYVVTLAGKDADTKRHDLASNMTAISVSLPASGGAPVAAHVTPEQCR
jgi:hypothetical protein